MPTLDPELQRLKSIDGPVIPGTTAVFYRRPRPDLGYRDPIAYISEIAVADTDEGEHVFKLSDAEGSRQIAGIKVSTGEADEPRMSIVVEDVDGIEPKVVGSLIGFGLSELGVSRAIVERNFTNLPPGFLADAGATAVRAHEDSGPEEAQAVEFSPPLLLAA